MAFNPLTGPVPAASLLQGPRLKSFATWKLEELAKALLAEELKNNKAIRNAVVSQSNCFEELEIFINNKIFNITQILQNSPDFEQISLSNEELEQYIWWEEKKFQYEPRSNKKILSREVFQERGIHGQFHYGEKLAINFYTVHDEMLQSFLRCHGKQGASIGLQKKELTRRVIEILLSTIAAAHGLQRPISGRESLSPEEKLSVINLRRYETDVYAEHDFVRQRIRDFQQQTVSMVPAFTSTSSPGGKYEGRGEDQFNVCSQIMEQTAVNPLGKNISALSNSPLEGEVLYPPGTQFQYTSYAVLNKKRREYSFTATPVRTIAGIDPYSYSQGKLEHHELLIIREELVNLCSRHSNRQASLTPLIAEISLILEMLKTCHDQGNLVELHPSDLLELKTRLNAHADIFSASDVFNSLNRVNIMLSAKQIPRQ